MTIYIKSAKDPKFWYANSIGGRLYSVIVEGKDEYVVRDNEGYLNIVLKEDAEVVDAD
jgi:hypothetical protein